MFSTSVRIAIRYLSVPGLFVLHNDKQTSSWSITLMVVVGHGMHEQAHIWPTELWRQLDSPAQRQQQGAGSHHWLFWQRMSTGISVDAQRSVSQYIAANAPQRRSFNGTNLTVQVMAALGHLFSFSCATTDTVGSAPGCFPCTGLG